MKNIFSIKIESRKKIFGIFLWSILFLILSIFVFLMSKYNRVDWNQNDGFGDPYEYGNIKKEYGFFRVYSFTMTAGVIVAILISFYNFRKKNIDIEDLFVLVIIVVPCSLLGASFFGKLNAAGPGKNANNASFIELFYFWNGGLAIHGGVYTGTIVGIIIAYFLSKKSKTSLLVYGDAIIPNILLGQSIGRWGNFFNHEVLGSPIANLGKGVLNSDSNVDKLFADYISSNGRPLFLPDFILKNVLVKYTGADLEINNLNIHNGDILMLDPIFLYESISLLAFWFIITKILPFICKMLSRIKNTKNEYNKDELINMYNDNKKLLENSNKKINKLNIKIKNNIILEKINNPKENIYLRSGIQLFLYFFSWNIVRYCLELKRPNNHLFIMYDKNLSLFIIGFSMFIGIIGAFICQYFYFLNRKPGWMYEIEYKKI